jgi:hypothetical protein
VRATALRAVQPGTATSASCFGWVCSACKADIVDLVLRHYYHGASGWDTARFDEAILSVQYGPAGDVIAAGNSVLIHLICAQTGAKFLYLKGHR